MKLTAYERPIHRQHNASAPKTYPGSVQQQALKAGQRPNTVYARLSKGWSLEEALNTPPMPQRESASKAGKASRAAARAKRLAQF